MNEIRTLALDCISMAISQFFKQHSSNYKKAGARDIDKHKFK